MRRILFCVVLLAACDRMAPARVDMPVDSAAGEVAFELAGAGGAALIVPVHINGEGPYQFVLDTGATVTCIDHAIASGLALPEVRGVLGTAAGVGGQGRLRLVSVDSLRLGGVSLHELQACVIDLEHLGDVGLDLDGLIGLNVLKEIRVTFDFERNVVTLAAP
ncbi:MAG: retropepsin-like aspartic protease [Longimicrobiales bacterium]